MSGTKSDRFFWSDWMSDKELRLCSYAARGLWKDMLCLMAANTGAHHGMLTVNGRRIDNHQLAKLTNGPAEEVEKLIPELEHNGVFSRTRGGVIYCRRMVKAEKNRRNGRLGGNPNFMSGQGNPDSLGVDPKPPIHSTQYTEPSKKESIAEPTTLFGSQVHFVEPSKDDWPEDYAEQWWAAYPPGRKSAKLKVIAKLESIRKGGKVKWALMIAKVREYAAWSSDPQFTKGPLVWLNGGDWMAELAPRKPAARKRTFLDIARGDFGRDQRTDDARAADAPRIEPGPGSSRTH